MSSGTEDLEDVCELCGCPDHDPVFNSGRPLAVCEGHLVCERCARERGLELARFADDVDDDLRGS